MGGDGEGAATQSVASPPAAAQGPHGGDFLRVFEYTGRDICLGGAGMAVRAVLHGALEVPVPEDFGLNRGLG